MEVRRDSVGGAHLGRRTKIIATVGPASWEPAVLEQLVAAGAAERAGFEPAMEREPHTHLTNEYLQPLGHLSRRREGQSRGSRGEACGAPPPTG